MDNSLAEGEMRRRLGAVWRAVADLAQPPASGVRDVARWREAIRAEAPRKYLAVASELIGRHPTASPEAVARLLLAGVPLEASAASIEEERVAQAAIANILRSPGVPVVVGAVSADQARRRIAAIRQHTRRTHP